MRMRVYTKEGRGICTCVNKQRSRPLLTWRETEPHTMRSRLRTDEKYLCQARTVAGGSILASIASLGAVGVGTWLLIYSQDFVELIGLSLRDGFAGFSVFGAYMMVTGMIGACVGLCRSSIGLLAFAGLLVSNLVCQSCIFAYLIQESREVMSNMNDTIKHTTNCRTFTTLEYKFHCDLEVKDYLFDQCLLDTESTSTDLESCTNSINAWIIKGVWSAVAVASVLIAFQILLIIMSLLLRHMISETRNYVDCCCPWQQRQNRRTSPVTLVTVTPTTNYDREMSSDDCYFDPLSPAGWGTVPHKKLPPSVTINSHHNHYNHKNI